MTDIIKSENNVPIRFADMGDGTYAEVTATNLFASGANFNLIGDGKSLTSTGTSVSTLIPFDSTSLLAAGSVRVAVTDPGYIRIESTEAAASATDILVNPEDSILINTEGKRFISFVSLVGEATANIQPIGGGSFKMFESSLDLNFNQQSFSLNGRNVQFSDLITFSRASSASFVDADGYLAFASANQPRFDYDFSTLQPKGLLIEEQRTNLFTLSEHFESAVWSKNAGATVTANNLLSPDNTLDADTLNAAASASSGFFRSVTTTAATPYTFSIFIKDISAASNLRIGIDTNPVNGFVTYDATTGTITATGANVTKTEVQTFANGWRRICVSVVATSTTMSIVCYSMSGALANFGVWGCQIEFGSYATSYIRTEAAQATRLADNVQLTAQNFQSFYNPAESTVYAEFTVNQSQSTQIASIVNINADDNLNRSVFRAQTAGGTSQFSVRSNNILYVSLSDISAKGILNPGVIHKSAMALKRNNFAAVISGGTVNTYTSGEMPLSQTVLRIGSEAVDFGYINGHARRILYIPQRISNTELQALTN